MSSFRGLLARIIFAIANLPTDQHCGAWNTGPVRVSWNTQNARANDEFSAIFSPTLAAQRKLAARQALAVTTNLRIVIVEDNGLIAMDLAQLLKGMGHEVCAIAGTEVAAEAAAARCRPDLMIVDGTLGSGSGVAAMRRILKLGDIAHFYVTGDPWKIRKLAPDAIIMVKPFSLQDLNRGIAGACNAARRRATA